MTPDHHRTAILGFAVDAIPFDRVVARIEESILLKRSDQIITANSLMLLEAEKDPELADVFRRAELVVPDSAGILWAGRWQGNPLPEQIPGIDLMLRLCDDAARKGWSVYLLGAAPGVAAETARELARRYPGLRIAGNRSGYFSDDDLPGVLKDISSSGAQLLFVGLDVPRQEKWIRRHLTQLNVNAAMGVGGSFDVISGRLRRAPVWMRRMGLEWMFRFLQQPWRIVRISHLPLFVWKVLTRPSR
ncbi:MAG TPA: WecB/TagA/CpsF family glycosyltransferase [Elusimicrobiota bacterium]|nr:WecB/TagA/CpsF family glycosyltransferase [Elusimicrobiota bacterium]